MNAEHWHKFEKDYSRDSVSWSEIPLKLSTLTPDKIMTNFSVTKTDNFMPRVEVNERAFLGTLSFKNSGRSLKAHDMMDWFPTR